MEPEGLATGPFMALIVICCRNCNNGEEITPMNKTRTGQMPFVGCCQCLFTWNTGTLHIWRLHPPSTNQGGTTKWWWTHL